MSYPVASCAAEVAANLAEVRHRIAAAADRAGRSPDEVRLLPVSKTVDDERIRWAYEAGCRLLGENKAQEARRKAELFASMEGLEWAMIGHLQTNKVRDVVGSAVEFHALDSLRIAEALERRLQDRGESLDVFVQVNSSGEESKYGLPPSDVAGFLRSLAPFECIRVRGLMTLAVNSPEVDEVRACFRLMRELRDQLRETVARPEIFGELSMGMSGDFELAVEEGSTSVRVGQAIFGARATPDSEYWPG